MFNFKTLKLDRREDPENTNSFVGIKKNANNEMEFRLPRGFDNFPDNDFEATKNLFFKMYRTFKKFERDNQNNKSLKLDKKPTEKDNIETGGNGYQFKDKEDNEVLLYSKISVIENLLEAYHDLALNVIERRSGRNEEIDYSKIDKYLHKATYLDDDDVIYIDEMELPRHFLQYQSATLIDLFCFILYELESELEQETDERVKELANRFKEQHLTYDQSLFDEETFDTTITALKDSLDAIDKVTAYKDEDYWQLYEAIESFLYGELDMKNTHEDGVFWGIDNFYQIWEDMCNTYMFSKANEYNIIYADTNIIFNGKNISNCSFGSCRIFKKDDFENPFFIEFRDNSRWMRPDLITLQKTSNLKKFNYENFIISISKRHGNYVDFDISLENNFNEKNLIKDLIKKLKKKISSKARHFAKNGDKVSKFNNNNVENYPFYFFKNIFLEYKEEGKESIVFDWKYMDESLFFSKNKKLESDITKQLCYEFSIEKSLKNDIEIESQFIIPFFYNKILKPEGDIGDFIEDNELYNRLQNNNIRVFKANFKKIQEVYLNHD